jgi:endonuclease/exonuclease/phosphatase (EEP) superfamily protein YafD
MAVTTSGCTAMFADQRAPGSERLASHAQGIATDAPECLERLASDELPTGPELESTAIRLVSWNVKKGERERWTEDFTDLSLGTDLVLIQEAALKPDAADSARHWSFAPGYRSASLLTGVMTYSSSEPLTQCNLTSWEPWLGTPKATGITEYGLTGTDATLVVVNIHAVNFAFGIKDFRDQLEQIRPMLTQHSGPIILSGDFNTWRKGRLNTLGAFVGDFGLEAVEFDEDHRTIFFGQRVDHIYIRGLTVESAGTRQVLSSDHNPLIAEFSL